MYIIPGLAHLDICIKKFLILFVVIVSTTMEGCYDDDDIVAEDEVTLALSYLNLNNPSHIGTSPANALSNQQMARQCLLSKRYNKKHHFVYSIKQKLPIL
jgi:hypothetical protein